MNRNNIEICHHLLREDTEIDEIIETTETIEMIETIDETTETTKEIDGIREEELVRRGKGEGDVDVERFDGDQDII
jgi:hypothetical protein